MSVDSDLSSFETSTPGGSGNGMMAAMLIGFAGVLLGAAALYFSLGGSGKADDAKTDLEAMTAKAEGLETRLRDLEAKYSESASQLSAAEQKLNLMARDTNNALKQVGAEINRNRTMIETTADKLTELIDTLNRSDRPTTRANSPATPAPAAPTQAASTTDGASPTERLPVATVAPTDAPSSPVTVGQSPITHTIRSGDTFTKLSDQYSVSVAAILAANPDVDPRRLAVGQKIKIPAQ